MKGQFGNEHPMREWVRPTCGGKFRAIDERYCPTCHAREHAGSPQHLTNEQKEKMLRWFDETFSDRLKSTYKIIILPPIRFKDALTADGEVK